ncbi:MAG: hypothetical protein MHPDNHAH_01134 [Anaerolineales bacterium]|nr:hypothetical protein [Anaerolineales bacterium]
MNANDYFYQLLSIEPVYETEDVFFEPFWVFKYRFQSLQRHWELSKKFIANHISALKNTKGDDSGEFDMAFSETAEVDFEYFPEYLRASTLSFSLSLVENLLANLSEEVARDLDIKVEFENKRLPYINKYILWLTKGCGIDINIDEEVWKSLEAIRQVRNKFVHRIDKDISEEVKKVVSEMVSDIAKKEKTITDEFVDVALLKISKLVKTIELAYIKFYKKTNG